MCVISNILRTCKLCHKQTPFRRDRVECEAYADVRDWQQAQHSKRLDTPHPVFEVFEGGPHGVVHCDWCQEAEELSKAWETHDAREQAWKQIPDQMSMCTQFCVEVKCTSCGQNSRSVNLYRWCVAHPMGQCHPSTVFTNCGGEVVPVPLEVSLPRCALCDFKERYVEARDGHRAEWHPETPIEDQRIELFIRTMDTSVTSILTTTALRALAKTALGASDRAAANVLDTTAASASDALSPAMGTTASSALDVPSPSAFFWSRNRP